MAKYTILYWQEIPSLVEATDDDGTHKIQLSQRFQALIDNVAMKRELAGTDAYLEEWNRGEIQERDGTAEEVVKAVSDEPGSPIQRSHGRRHRRQLSPPTSPFPIRPLVLVPGPGGVAGPPCAPYAFANTRAIDRDSRSGYEQKIYLKYTK